MTPKIVVHYSHQCINNKDDKCRIIAFFTAIFFVIYEVKKKLCVSANQNKP